MESLQPRMKSSVLTILGYIAAGRKVQGETVDPAHLVENDNSNMLVINKKMTFNFHISFMRVQLADSSAKQCKGQNQACRVGNHSPNCPPCIAPIASCMLALQCKSKYSGNIPWYCTSQLVLSLFITFARFPHCPQYTDCCIGAEGQFPFGYRILQFLTREPKC